MADNRAGNAASMEKLFDAIDIIMSEKIASLQYDKTITATIINDDEADRGRYIVSTGASEFEAFSNEGTYSKDTNVYVIIPQNNYNNTKLIVGRVLEDGDTFYSYNSQSDSFVSIVSKLIPDSANGSLVANGRSKMTSIWRADGLSYKGYTRLLLTADFRTWLSYLDVIGGTYGLYLYVISREPRYHRDESTQGDLEQTHVFKLMSNEMYGNPYNFETYYIQEKLFDISEINEIISMELLFVQGGDFSDSEGKLITVPDDANYPANLFVAAPTVSLGYDVGELNGDEVRLYTTDSQDYDATYTDTAIEKHMLLRWIHQYPNGTIKVIDVPDEIVENALIHWYHYVKDKSVCDKLAGVYWKEIPEALNQFDYSFIPDIKVGTEKFKVIIEVPSRESVVKDISIIGFNTEIDKAEKITDGQALENARKSYYDNTLKAYQEYKQLIVNYGTQQKDKYKNYSAALAKLAEIETAQAQVETWKSKELAFDNLSYDPVSDAIDLISGLTISADQDGFNGSYMIYSDTGLIQNAEEATKIRTLRAEYESLITGEELLDRAEKITWYFPVSNTMIQTPQKNIEYTKYENYRTIDKEATEKEITEIEERARANSSNDTEYLNILNKSIKYSDLKADLKEAKALPLNIKYIAIDRAIVTGAGERGSSFAQQADQYFRIKDYYNENEKNNTIYCSVLKNGQRYWAHIDLAFGASGTNGTDATFLLEMYEEEDGVRYLTPAMYLKEKTKAIIVPKLYDHNNKDITDSISSVRYDWFREGDGGLDIPSRIFVKNSETTISFTSGATIEKCQYYILKAEIPWTIVDQGTKKNDDGEEVVDENPSTREVYLTAYLPVPVGATKEQITQVTGPTKIIYSKDGTDPIYYKEKFKTIPEVDSITWKGACQEYNSDPKVLSYYPMVSEDGQLTPTTMYLGIEKGYAVNVLDKDKKIIWTQPILIIQNRYSSAMLNAWDGKFFIDEENGTIMSTMVGAGRKESDDNTFSGVLMGDVQAGAKFNEQNKSGLGLYGFNHGAQSFGFNVDGTAFIGKAGRGRINFNGNFGTISSGNYIENVSGMLIDLDGKDGLSASMNAFGPGGYFVVDTAARAKDADDEPLLSLGTISNMTRNPMLYVGKSSKDSFYLKSVDYQNDDTAKKGVMFDLKKNRFYMFGNGTNGKHITFSSDGTKENPYLDINDGTKSILYAGDSGYYLESHDYNAPAIPELAKGTTSGVRIDLVNGYMVAERGNIAGWQFDKEKLFSLNDSGTETMQIKSNGSMSGGTSYKWYILDTGEANFSQLHAATGGTMGPFTFTSTSLSMGGVYNLRGGQFYIGTQGMSVDSAHFVVTSSGNVEINGDLVVNGTIHGGNLANGTSGGNSTSWAAGPNGMSFGGGCNLGGWLVNTDGSLSSESGGTVLYPDGKIDLLNTQIRASNLGGISFSTAIHIYKYISCNEWVKADTFMQAPKFKVGSSDIDGGSSLAGYDVYMDGGGFTFGDFVKISTSGIEVSGGSCGFTANGKEGWTGRITFLDESYFDVQNGIIVSGLSQQG